MLPTEAVLSKQHNMMAPPILSMSSSIAIEYDDESHHHIVTVPSFIRDEDDDTSSYPSLLHHIHVLPLLTNDETTHLLQLARTYATDNQSWKRQDATRHVSYPTVDFAIEESIDIESYLNEIDFEERIFTKLSTAYDVDVEDMSFLDLFCASYEAKDDTDNINDSEDEKRTTMDRLDYHRDGSLLSFTILLSPLDDFEGGGTIFDSLGDVSIDDKCDILQSPGVIQPPHAGYATLHSGKLLHGGQRVSKGQRIVLVGFVDVHERNMKPGLLGKATKHWGRNDVSTFYNKRRLSLLKQQIDEGNEQPEWKIRNWRYLAKDTRSYFGKDFKIPPSILDNIERRASLERIRSKRLITEDKVLREILLPREERAEKIAEQQEGGEWIEVDLADMDDGIMLG